MKERKPALDERMNEVETANVVAFDYEILQHVVTLAQIGKWLTLELNLINWNGYVKYDLRWWSRNRGGAEWAQKGITLTRDQMIALREAMLAIDEGEIMATD